MRTRFFLFVFIIAYASSCKKNDAIILNSFSKEVVSGASGTTIRKKYGKMTDIDGNVYKTIQIGKQIWMADNLRVTKYRNGNPIQQVENNQVWENLDFGAWSYYSNVSEVDLTYGKLYNWFSVNDARGLAPKGWHIPTSIEVVRLVEFLGGDTEAGGLMKETGTTYWASPNEGATNSSGFSARPAGKREFNGDFINQNREAGFWTSTLNNSFSANIFYLGYDTKSIYLSPYYMTAGFSIRCIKD